MVEYVVDQTGFRIYATPRGVLDLSKILRYFKRLKSDHRIRQNAIDIIDVKNITDFKTPYINSNLITEVYRNPEIIHKIEATFLICESNLAYKIGKILQSIHEMANPDHKVIIVRSGKDLESVIKRFKMIFS